MYMPGRLRTASRPSRTWRSLETYELSAMARPSGGMGNQAIAPPTWRPEAQVEEADHDGCSLPAGGDSQADLTAPSASRSGPNPGRWAVLGTHSLVRAHSVLLRPV